jgi:hypothetical protein
MSSKSDRLAEIAALKKQLAKLKGVERAVTKPEPAAIDDIKKMLAPHLAQSPLAPVGDRLMQTGSNILEGVGNIPSSAVKYAKDVAYPVMHPQETVESLGNLGSGLLHKTPFYPGEQDDEKYPDAVGAMLSDRYGGIEEIGRTLRTDPVGALGDAAGLLTGVGMIPRLSKAGTLGRSIEPANLAFKAAGRLADVPKNIPKNMYSGVLKFPTVKDPARRGDIIQQLLDDGVRPNVAGMDKLQSKIAGNENAISKAIDEQAAYRNDVLGVEIPYEFPTEPLLESASARLDRLNNDTATAAVAMDPARDAGRKVLENAQSAFRQAGETMSLQDIQRFKRNLYKAQKFDKNVEGGALGTSDTVNSLRGDMAQKAKELIENQVPVISGLNQTYGKRLEARDPLARSSNRLENRSNLGLSARLLGGGGLATGYAHGDPIMGLLGGLAASALLSPGVTTEAAMLLNKLGNSGPMKGFRNMPLDPGLLTELIAQGLLQSGRLRPADADKAAGEEGKQLGNFPLLRQ